MGNIMYDSYSLHPMHKICISVGVSKVMQQTKTK